MGVARNSNSASRTHNLTSRPVSKKKAKKIAQRQRLKLQRDENSMQSNRQRKADKRKAALETQTSAKKSASNGEMSANDTTLGGPESHSMWI